MQYLVDGYNVLYSLGLLRKGGDARAAERARQALVQRILSALGAEAEQVVVLFDAAQAPADMPRKEQLGPLRVLYSSRRQDADSLIEELLQGCLPSRVVIVSADRRLQQAARRRRCACWSPERFTTWLEKRRQQRLHEQSSPDDNDKETLAREPKETWLQEFAHLDKDSQLGQADPFAHLDITSILNEIEDDKPHPGPAQSS